MLHTHTKNSPDLGETLWFDAQNYKNTQTYMSLTDNGKIHADNMHDNGYTIIKKAVSEQECDAVISAVNNWVLKREDEFNSQIKPDGTTPRIINLHTENKDVLNLFLNSKVLEVQDILYGYPTALYTSLYFKQGSQQPIHRDVPVFSTTPQNFYFGVWYALEESNIQNGTLEAYPGGHKLEIDQYALAKKYYEKVEDIPAVCTNLWMEYQAAIVEKCQQHNLKKVTIPFDKGDVIIWHPLLPHGGGPILDKTKTRNSVVFHTAPQGVPVRQGDDFYNWEQPNNRITERTYQFISSDRLMAGIGKASIVNT